MIAVGNLEYLVPWILNPFYVTTHWEIRVFYNTLWYENFYGAFNFITWNQNAFTMRKCAFTTRRQCERQSMILEMGKNVPKQRFASPSPSCYCCQWYLLLYAIHIISSFVSTCEKLAKTNWKKLDMSSHKRKFEKLTEFSL